MIPFSFLLPLPFFLAAEFPFPSVDAFDLKPLVPAVLSRTIAAITLLSPQPPQSVCSGVNIAGFYLEIASILSMEPREMPDTGLKRV